MQILRKYWKPILVVLAIAVIATYLDGRGSVRTFSQSVDDFAYEEEAYGAISEKVDFDGADTMAITSETPGIPEVIDPTVQRQVIQTGNLEMIVADVEVTIQTIKTNTTDKWNGFVSESSIDDYNDDSRAGWISIRIPANQFDTIIDQIKGLSLKVESENTRADDVTRQIADSDARMKNFRAQEAQYLEVLGKAGSIDETLKATDYLNRVRGEIERLDAQLKTLNEQVALSTLNISVSDEGDVRIFGVYWQPAVKFKQAARDALENITEAIDFLIVLVVNIPLLIVGFLFIFLVAKLGWRLIGKTWYKVTKSFK